MENQITIDSIEFVPVSRPEAGLLGFVGFTACGFSFQSIGVHSILSPVDRKIRLVFPAKPVGSKYLYFFRPLNKELEEKIRIAVEQKLEELGFFKP